MDKYFICYLKQSGIVENGTIEIDGAIKSLDDLTLLGEDIAKYDEFEGEECKIIHYKKMELKDKENREASYIIRFLEDETDMNSLSLTDLTLNGGINDLEDIRSIELYIAKQLKIEKIVIFDFVSV